MFYAITYYFGGTSSREIIFICETKPQAISLLRDWGKFTHLEEQKGSGTGVPDITLVSKENRSPFPKSVDGWLVVYNGYGFWMLLAMDGLWTGKPFYSCS